MEDQNLTPETAPAPAPGVERYMFLGPKVTDPVLLRHKSVYIGLPEKALASIKDEELRLAARACFVPMDEAGAALRELEGQRPPAQYTANYKALERLIGGKK